MIDSFVLRPVTTDDLSALADLIGNVATPHRRTPLDPEYFEGRVQASARAFYPQIQQPGSEHYLFVLAEAKTGRLVGTAGILAQAGTNDPTYTFEVRKEPQFYAPLQISREVRTLHLRRTPHGPAELCSLFLHPAHRRDGWGQLLSRGRLLFMHRFPERFAPGIRAKLAGYRDRLGQAPFWDGVASYFFKRDPSRDDPLGSVGARAIVETLLPRHPLYAGLLPPAAREAIGQIDHGAEGAQQILKAEGFMPTAEIDLLDGGPIYEGELSKLRTIRGLNGTTIQGDLVADSSRRPNVLVSNRSLGFRAILTYGEKTADGALKVSAAALENLAVEPGAVVDTCFLNEG